MSYITYTTQSGSRYVYDPGAHRIKRLESEDVWQNISEWNDPIVGQRMFLQFGDNSKFQITTPVVRIEAR